MALGIRSFTCWHAPGLASADPVRAAWRRNKRRAYTQGARIAHYAPRHRTHWALTFAPNRANHVNPIWPEAAQVASIAAAQRQVAQDLPYPSPQRPIPAEREAPVPTNEPTTQDRIYFGGFLLDEVHSPGEVEAMVQFVAVRSSVELHYCPDDYSALIIGTPEEIDEAHDLAYHYLRCKGW